MKKIQNAGLFLLLLAVLICAAKANAANPFNGRFREFTRIADGVIEPLAHGLVYTYEAGTTTPKATYTTSTGDIENTNPILLDSEGFADIYLGSGNYKIDVKDANGVSLPGYPVDDVEGTVFLLDTITASSSTSIAMATGTKTFEIEANKAIPLNAWVLISYDGDPQNNYMIGQVTDYTGVNLEVDVTQFVGSGTYNDWTIALSGPPGPQGPTGPNGAGTGDLLAAQNLADLADIPTALGNLGIGSAGLLDVGTTANKVLQLDSSAKIPAVDGSQVTNLNASSLASGTVATARLGTGTANSSSFLRGDSTWSANINPTSYQGIGTYGIFKVQAAVTVAAGATTSGANLRVTKFDSAGTLDDGIGAPSGTWRNMAGTTLIQNDFALFVRTE
jgi:hypothetical protein